jgi:hypothetical protein
VGWMPLKMRMVVTPVSEGTKRGKASGRVGRG